MSLYNAKSHTIALLVHCGKTTRVDASSTFTINGQSVRAPGPWTYRQIEFSAILMSAYFQPLVKAPGNL